MARGGNGSSYSTSPRSDELRQRPTRLTPHSAAPEAHTRHWRRFPRSIVAACPLTGAGGHSAGTRPPSRKENRNDKTLQRDVRMSTTHRTLRGEHLIEHRDEGQQGENQEETGGAGAGNDARGCQPSTQPRRIRVQLPLTGVERHASAMSRRGDSKCMSCSTSSTQASPVDARTRPALTRVCRGGKTGQGEAKGKTAPRNGGMQARQYIRGPSRPDTAPGAARRGRATHIHTREERNDGNTHNTIGAW